MAQNRWKDSLVYQTVMFFGWICRLLSNKWAMSLGTVIGKLLFRILKKRRQIALSNLQIAFGNDINEERQREICKASFINFSKTIIEFMRFSKLTPENMWNNVTVDGVEHLNRALDKGKGAIVFLPHFGNWELLSLVYGLLIPNRAKAIAFPLKNAKLNDYVWQSRELMSLELIPRKNAIRSTLRALKNNDAVGFFADQNAGEQGVFIEFFGKHASTAKGPVAIALKTDAPILFSLDIRQPNNQHQVHISPPIYMEPSNDTEHDIEKYTTILMKKLEKYIEQYPEQWLWLHNRWKTQPK
ncbi:MAG: lysophospholipid acyltransferase family protein [Candidatus Poribacteria bacterium]|nr:lysophospholipid acyltransferase family protein [Candidatus Poribacteria bacterium]